MFVSLLSAFCSIKLMYRVEYRVDRVHSNGTAVPQLCAAGFRLVRRRLVGLDGVFAGRRRICDGRL
jgi:hypothetical protein